MLAGPAALANYAILGFVLGRGQGSIGLLLQTLINGINIDLCNRSRLGLGLGLGVAGVAWGSMIGETAGAIAGLVIVARGFAGATRPSRSELLSRARLAALFALNRDILIRTFVLLAAFTLMTRIGGQFGAVTLAANAVLMNFVLISAFYLDGLANAAEQITGRAIGAGYRPAFDRGLKLTMLWSFGLAAIATLFFLGLGPRIIAVLTTSERCSHGCRNLPAFCSSHGPYRRARLSDGRRFHRRYLVERHAKPHAACLRRLPNGARHLRAAARQCRPVAGAQWLPFVSRRLPDAAGQAAGRSDLSACPVIEPGIAQFAD